MTQKTLQDNQKQPAPQQAQAKADKKESDEFKELLHRPLVEKLASVYEQSPVEYIAALRASALRVKDGEPEFTKSEIQAFLTVANQYDLDPLRGEIYCMRNRGKLLIIVGVDGWIQIMQRSEAFDGLAFEYTDDPKTGKPIACKAIIHRSDLDHPIEVSEYLDECQRATEPWNKWPRRMLRHKALIQCVRVAFRISGILDEDEAARARSVSLDGEARPATTDPLAEVEARLKETLNNLTPEKAKNETAK